jgi:hypothetical protein
MIATIFPAEQLKAFAEAVANNGQETLVIILSNEVIGDLSCDKTSLLQINGFGTVLLVPENLVGENHGNRIHKSGLGFV